MTDERNRYQIVRKDARGCFVESLSDGFIFGRIHMTFATYDLSLPAGKRQTNRVDIYLPADEFLDLCCKLSSGELRFLVQNRKKNGDNSPLYESLGGTSAEKLAQHKRKRKDGKSLSRTFQIICGKSTDFLLIAESGPGETNKTGLIVPKFGKTPENHVAVAMTLETFSELMLITKAHFDAWLAAWYWQNFQKQNETMEPADVQEEKSSFF